MPSDHGRRLMQPPADVLAKATGAPVEEAPTLDGITRALVPLADRLRLTLADIEMIALHEATPAQRSQLATLYDEIDRVVRDATTWRDAILYAFRDAAIRLNAKEIPLADGVAQFVPPRDEWRVDVPALAAALRDMVRKGLVSQGEYEQVFTTKVEEQANGTKLNALARNRGDEVKAAIDAHRRLIPGDPLAAKVKFVRNRE